jgi:hypothetical protein
MEVEMFISRYLIVDAIVMEPQDALHETAVHPKNIFQQFSECSGGHPLNFRPKYCRAHWYSDRNIYGRSDCSSSGYLLSLIASNSVENSSIHSVGSISVTLEIQPITPTSTYI